MSARTGAGRGLPLKLAENSTDDFIMVHRFLYRTAPVALLLLVVSILQAAPTAAEEVSLEPAPAAEPDPGCGGLSSTDAPDCHGGPRDDIVITEVMQNPSLVWDSVGEWFEIYNAGAGPVDLSGWTVTDELNNTHIISGPLVIQPGSYLVFGRNGDAGRNGGVVVDYVTGNDIFLFNSSDRLVLIDGDGREVDRVVWDDGRSFPDPNGASMSLASLGRDNSIGSNWCTSTTVFGVGDLGTPGRANSCATGTRVIITEIMQNPDAVPDSRGDWFEVYNPNTVAVDLAGWTIRDDDDDSHVIADSLVVPAGGYAVIGRNGDSSLNGGVPVDYVTGSDILLHNNFDELVLIDPAGVRIDRVVWDDGRTFPDPTGASMSLSSLTADNSRGANWCRATTPFGAGDFGTPGAPNNCADPETVPPMARLVITEIMSNPNAVLDNDGEWFEIYNREPEPVDINGWTIRDFDTNLHVIDNDGPLVIPGNGYVVLGRNADIATNGGVPVDYSYGAGMVLYNASDEVVIVDPNGTIVDQVAYDDGYTFPDADGSAMALESLSLRNDVGEHWCPASTPYGNGDRGTPGSANTCGPGVPLAPLIINEIMLNPATVPDSVGEWFEIFNPTQEPVDINGWVVRDDDYNQHTIDNGGALFVPADGYLVMGREGSTWSNGGVTLDYEYGTGMVLYNASDELVLVDSNYIEVDRVEWDDGRTFPDPVGASMSLIEPTSDNSLGANWCVSAGSYGRGERGTPGAQNECAPACSIDGVTVAVTAAPDTLWPPNGRLHQVETEVTVLGSEPGVLIKLVDVSSNESDPTSARFPDIVIIDDFHFELRAERYGYGDGRIYTITYEIVLPCGASDTFSTTVSVVHDQGNSAL